MNFKQKLGPPKIEISLKVSYKELRSGTLDTLPGNLVNGDQEQWR